MTNGKDIVYLTSNPDTGLLILQFLYRSSEDRFDGWSRYLSKYETQGWEWTDDDVFDSSPIGHRCLLQW